MNTDFCGGVLVARMLEGMHFAVGPTIAARRSALASDWRILSVERLSGRRLRDGEVRGGGWLWRDPVFLCHRTSHWQRGSAAQCRASAAMGAKHSTVAAAGVSGSVAHHAGTACASGLLSEFLLVAGVACGNLPARLGRGNCLRESFARANRLAIGAARRSGWLLLLAGWIFRKHDHLARK